ncbi:26918_t:CDS:1, partial [Racocetra persica]
ILVIMVRRSFGSENYAKRENVKIPVTLYEIKENETISTLSKNQGNEEKRTI